MLILDVQGFQSASNKFIVKELAVKALHSNDCSCLMFQPPNDWDELTLKYQRTNRWLIHNHHGLLWEEGFISYGDIAETITHILGDASVIFVNGHEKQQWLEGYTDKMVINLNLMGAAKAKNMTAPGCWVHGEHSIIKKGYICAFENCHKLAEWYKTYFGASLTSTINLGDWIKDMQMNGSGPLFLAKSFLIKFGWQHIDELWDALPYNLQKIDHDIQQYRRCYSHSPKAIDGEDVPDGPVPFRKDCPTCQLADWIIFS